MKKILGIITEYNPFHNGHSHHINKSKLLTGSDYVIAVMSGNYVQRGEPAILHKWLRTKTALLNGVDLVIDLPTMYSTASAELFSHASIKLLNDTNIVDSICFGSEIGSIDNLYNIAKILSDEPEDYKKQLKRSLSTGLNYPSARAEALNKVSGIDTSVLSNPNNILGIEYLKSLYRLNSSITPFTINRENSDYNSEEICGNISSAKAIRYAIKSGNLGQVKDVMPKSSYDILMSAINENISPVELNDFSSVLNFILRTRSLSDIKNILDVTEGLENRIYSSVRDNYDISSLSHFIKTKRYTHTKIQRALLHIALNIKKDDIEMYNKNGFSPYIKILGFRKESESLLGKITKNSSLPVIIGSKNVEYSLTQLGKNMFNNEKVYTDLYYMCMPNKAKRSLSKELTEPVVII